MKKIPIITFLYLSSVPVFDKSQLPVNNSKSENFDILNRNYFKHTKHITQYLKHKDCLKSSGQLPK
jgi:hypothetical protein